MFSVLLQHQLYIKLSKCEFGAIQIEYLGHVIGETEVVMDVKKVNCVKNSPPPKTLKELRRFLSLTGYYRRFVCHYGTIAQPLTNLLKKGEFQWHM